MDENDRARRLMFSIVLYREPTTADEKGHSVFHKDHIRIYSRYGFMFEFETMIKALDLMSPLSRSYIKQIFCDSKGGSSYVLTLFQRRSDVIASVCEELRKALLEVVGGYNDIAVEDSSYYLDPEWNEPMSGPELELVP